MKVGLIGRIDPSGDMCDGQTVKTRTIYRLLVEEYGQHSVYCVDTKDYKKRPIRVLIAFLVAIAKCDAFVVLLSRNGRKLFFPLLAFCSKHFGKKIYHNLIGGALLQDIESDPSCVDRLNSFEVNWVESRALKRQLTERGVVNVGYLPNFKVFVDSETNSGVLSSPFRFCTFSRVSKSKGILEAIKAIELLNAEHGVASYVLDIYGPIEDVFKSEFEAAINSSQYANYCGVTSADESLKVVAGYHALLFPTIWRGEGMPGTILDALAAGTPVVASHWAYYDEMLEDGVTGYSYPLESPELLAPCIKLLVDNSENYRAMCESCLERSKNYSAEKVFSEIRDALNSGMIEKSTPCD